MTLELLTFTHCPKWVFTIHFSNFQTISQLLIMVNSEYLSILILEVKQYISATSESVICYLLSPAITSQIYYLPFRRLTHFSVSLVLIDSSLAKYSDTRNIHSYYNIYVTMPNLIINLPHLSQPLNVSLVCLGISTRRYQFNVGLLTRISDISRSYSTLIAVFDSKVLLLLCLIIRVLQT